VSIIYRRVSANIHRWSIEIGFIRAIPADCATLNARYAVIITRHPTDSEQPAGAFDDGDQDAHTAPEPLPPEPARPSTAVLRSVGGDGRPVLPTPETTRNNHHLTARHSFATLTTAAPEPGELHDSYPWGITRPPTPKPARVSRDSTSRFGWAELDEDSAAVLAAPGVPAFLDGHGGNY
jgi:hypothetical protein